MSDLRGARAPRYDALAEWYDTFVRSTPFTEGVLDVLARMLGLGPGRCLDLGCGTGVAFPTLARLGWSVTGVDVSDGQLAVARPHAEAIGADLVLADAAHLPFPDGAFDAVACVLMHTDLDDPEAAWREAARVLRPSGRFAFVGMHPCFAAPMVQRRSEQPHLLHAGYRRRKWWFDAPGFRFGRRGIRGRAGVHHLPLAELLNGILAAGLRLERAEEPGADDYPLLLALAATRD